MRTVLEVLAPRHKEWVYMATSFGVNKSDGEELVSGMYLKLHDYVKDVERIMYSESEVNTFYVYKTIQNLFKSGYHTNGRTGGMLRGKFVVCDIELANAINCSRRDKDDFLFENDSDFTDYLNKALECSYEEDLDMESRSNSESMFDASFGDVTEDVKCIVDKWRWYDKKMFKLHFAELYGDEKGMSMRAIAKATNISLKSVFLTLKACKLRLREELQGDYDKWNKSKQVI